MLASVLLPRRVHVKAIGLIPCVLFASMTARAATETAATMEPYGYSQGSVQLILDSPPLISTSTPYLGFLSKGVAKGISYSTVNGDNTVVFGLSGGFGYCLSPVVEIGGVLAFNLANYSSGSGSNSTTIYEFMFEPMLKFNIGGAMGGAVNPFVMVGPLMGVSTASGGGSQSSTGQFGGEADLGVEFFIGHRWGLSLFVPVQVLDQTAAGGFIVQSGSAVTVSVGFGFGLFGYI
jgi:hypothetical protein